MSIKQRFTEKQLQTKATMREVLSVFDHATEHGQDLGRAINRLAHRLTAVEAYYGFRWCGPWASAESYAAGDLVKHGNEVWRAIAPTTTEPGASTAWLPGEQFGDRHRHDAGGGGDPERAAGAAANGSLRVARVKTRIKHMKVPA